MQGIDPTAGVLVFAAIAAGVVAWRHSNRQTAIIREMAEWLAEHRPTAWSHEPRLARRIFLLQAVDDLRRKGVADDPEFDRLYVAGQRERRSTIAWLLVAGVLIALSVLRIV